MSTILCNSNVRMCRSPFSPTRADQRTGIILTPGTIAAWERLQQRIRIEIPAAAPAPAPKRARWSIGRIFQIGFWSVMIYVIIISFAVIL